MKLGYVIFFSCLPCLYLTDGDVSIVGAIYPSDPASYLDDEGL